MDECMTEGCTRQRKNDDGPMAHLCHKCAWRDMQRRAGHVPYSEGERPLEIWPHDVAGEAD